MSANKARIIACMGASGSGKSCTVKGLLETSQPGRLLVWDPMDEYGPYCTSRVPNMRALVALVRDASKNGVGFRARYVPDGDSRANAEKFSVFCAVAFAAGNCTLVVEELQSVTSPSWAPAEWSNCTLRGRHRGLEVIGVSQRPAGVDKNFFGNATGVQTGRLNYAEDVRCMANVLAVRPEEIQSLKPLEFIARDMGTGEISRGTVPIPGGAAKKNSGARGAGRGGQ